MDIVEKHKILKEWMIKKYNQPDLNGWIYYSGSSDYLMLITSEFIRWQELLKKGYSEQQLIDYFIEIIRHDLPELIGTKLYFSINYDDYKIYKII